MNRRRLGAGVLLLLWAAGCAGVPVRREALQISVTPEVVRPGAIVRVTITAPPGTRDVRGRLDLPGSPVIPLKSQDQGKTWTLVTQIPLGLVWEPGRYHVLAEGVAPDGAVVYGSAWITAP